MIKLTTINILGQPIGILDSKKRQGLAEDYLKVYEIRAEHLSNNLRLSEIYILNKQKPIRNSSEATYGPHSNKYFEY